jgi:hypothetical protein
VTPWLRSTSSNRILGELARLFGRLPPTESVVHPLTRAGAAMCLGEFVLLYLSLIVAFFAGAVEILFTSMAGILFGITSMRIGESICPTHTRFVSEMTFGDLSRFFAKDAREAVW